MRSIQEIEEELQMKEERIAFWEKHGLVNKEVEI